jgi:hypothetical protein
LDVGESRSLTQIFQRNLQPISHPVWEYVCAFGADGDDGDGDDCDDSDGDDGVSDDDGVSSGGHST